jgi:hypothetical protein
MRAYPTQLCHAHYYYKNGQIFNTYEPESVFVLAPGDVVWKSDLEILESHAGDGPAEGSLNSVVAKYCINRHAQQ